MSTPNGPDQGAGWPSPDDDHGPQSQATPPRVNRPDGQQPPQQQNGPSFAAPQGSPGYTAPPTPPGYAPAHGQPQQGYPPQQNYPQQGYQQQLAPSGGPQSAYGNQYAGQSWDPDIGGPSPNRRVGLLVALAILIVVLLGAGAAVFFSFRETGAAPPPVPTETHTQTTSPEPAPSTSQPAPEPSTSEPEPSTPEPEPTATSSASAHVQVGELLSGQVCQSTATDPLGEVGDDGYVTSGAGFRFEAIPGWDAQPIHYPWIHQSNSQLTEVIPGEWIASVTVGSLVEEEGFAGEQVDAAARRLVECMLASNLFGEPPGDAEVLFAEFNDDGVFFLDVQVDILGVEGIEHDLLELVTVFRDGQLHVALAVIPDNDPEVMEQAQAAIRNLSWN